MELNWTKHSDRKNGSEGEKEKQPWGNQKMRAHKMTNTFITARSWRYKSERKNYHVMWNDRGCRCRRCCCCHHHHHHGIISTSIHSPVGFSIGRTVPAIVCKHITTTIIPFIRWFFLLSFNLSLSFSFSRGPNIQIESRLFNARKQHAACSISDCDFRLFDCNIKQIRFIHPSVRLCLFVHLVGWQ